MSWAETRRPSLTFALRRDLLLPLQGSQRQSGYAAPRCIPPPLPRYAAPPSSPVLSSPHEFSFFSQGMLICSFSVAAPQLHGMECNNLGRDD